MHAWIMCTPAALSHSQLPGVFPCVATLRSQSATGRIRCLLQLPDTTRTAGRPSLCRRQRWRRTTGSTARQQRFGDHRPRVGRAAPYSVVARGVCAGARGSVHKTHLAATAAAAPSARGSPPAATPVAASPAGAPALTGFGGAVAAATRVRGTGRRGRGHARGRGGVVSRAGRVLVTAPADSGGSTAV